MIGSTVQHEEILTASPVVKRRQRHPQKAPKSPEFVKKESDDSEDDAEERKPMVKRIQILLKKAPKSPEPVKTESDDSDDDEEEEPKMKKAPKSPGLVETDPEDSDTEDTLKTIGFPVNKFLEVGKNEEKPALKKGIYRGKKYHMLQNLVPTTLKKC